MNITQKTRELLPEIRYREELKTMLGRTGRTQDIIRQLPTDLQEQVRALPLYKDWIKARRIHIIQTSETRDEAYKRLGNDRGIYSWLHNHKEVHAMWLALPSTYQESVAAEHDRRYQIASNATTLTEAAEEVGLTRETFANWLYKWNHVDTLKRLRDAEKHDKPRTQQGLGAAFNDDFLYQPLYIAPETRARALAIVPKELWPVMGLDQPLPQHQHLDDERPLMERRNGYSPRGRRVA